MNKETKNEVKKNVATGTSTAAGAAAGVVIGAAITPETAEAAEVVTPEPVSQPSLDNTPTPQPNNEHTPTSKPEPTPQPTLTPEPKPEPNDVEVLSYDRVTNEDGSQMDVAVLNVNGNEVGVIDANLDGEADVLMCDINQNGVIEENEVELVQGQGMMMQPLADAAGFNPQFAQNDLPDYVNDADVDPYMA